ncbi:MAG: glycosyltransferase [Acidocella sp.]|nr:glycosyltransferase [Acidocella sp.]
MIDIIFDLRCFQNPSPVRRGIARHAMMLLATVRGAFPQARVLGLMDQALPNLPEDVRGLADEVIKTAGLVGRGDAIFINPSPLEGDQVFVARLLLNQSVLRVAALYDFIPYEAPELYMKTASERLAYGSALVWLRHYDVLLSISETTKVLLTKILPVGPDCVVTGVAVSLLPASPLALLPVLAIEDTTKRHIFCAGGDDARKNIALLIKAHAGSAILQARKIPLVVTGAYQPDAVRYFYGLVAAAGGNASLLRLVGLATTEKMQSYYRNAFCVVTPSRREGFSLPVVEAMQASVPSIASDIPTHAELVRDAALRFGVDDVAGLRGLMERVVREPDFAAEIVAGQREIWPRFTPDKVAARCWAPVQARLQHAKMRSTPKRRARVAVISPMPPVASGVADFTSAMLQALAKNVDVFVFPPGSAQAYIEPYYDRVLSVVGNAADHHLATLAHVQRYGGACLCHDSRLINLYEQALGLSGAAKIASRELQRNVSADEISLWLADENARQADFLGEIAAAARPLILHSKLAAQSLCMRGISAYWLNFPIYRPWDAPISLAQKQAARARLGLHGNVIISLGFIMPSKGLAPALHAMTRLRVMGVQATLVWVGQPACDLAPWRAQALALGVADNVVFSTGFVDEARYRDFICAADVGLQLRLGGRGNISGALQDCIAAGLPCVASNDLAQGAAAPHYVSRVNDMPEPDEIAQALAAWLQAPRVTDAERADYAQNHSMARYAEGLCRLLELD